jgi:hypothetical protein
MLASSPKLVEHVIEKQPKELWDQVPKFVKGIYCLLNKKGEVVNVGMVRGERSGIRNRLKRHVSSKVGWTHFSIFQFWRNRHDDIPELEGISRHLYRFDKRKGLLAKQRRYLPLTKITHRSFERWKSHLNPSA